MGLPCFKYSRNKVSLTKFFSNRSGKTAPFGISNIWYTNDIDHSHLGQLITYAAGLRAVTMVWDFKAGVFINSKEERQGVMLTIAGPIAENFIRQLLTEKTAIEPELGGPIEWLEKSGKIESTIRWQMHNIHLAN